MPDADHPSPRPALPYGPQTPAVRRFLQRLAALHREQWQEAVAAYEAVQRTRAFAGADRALGAAVARSAREAERDAVLGPLLRLVHAAAADGPTDDGDAVPLAPIAEPALAAVLALLMRDVLPPAVFDTLYAPFVGLVPPALLDEPGAAR